MWVKLLSYTVVCILLEVCKENYLMEYYFIVNPGSCLGQLYADPPSDGSGSRRRERESVLYIHIEWRGGIGDRPMRERSPYIG